MSQLKINVKNCPLSIGESGGNLYAFSHYLKQIPKNHGVVYFELPVNKQVKSHSHPKEEESYYILSGNAEAIIDNELFLLMPGDYLYIPPGSKHELKNSGSVTLTMLAIFSSPEAVESLIC
jgi:quercetin dioxygenase-like cupin family protein